MLILRCPTASGKNTIGHIIAKAQLQCAVIDFDCIENIFVQAHLTLWDGEEGRAQQLLGIKHICNIAIEFDYS